VSHKSVDEECIEYVSKWFDFAILEILSAGAGADEPGAMASRLGISLVEVADSLRRLQLTGFIEGVEGTWRVRLDNTYTTFATPSDHIKHMHEQLLQKALTALFSQPMPERHFESYILSFELQNMDAAREKIQSFVQQFNSEFGTPAPTNEVYCLGIQFHRLTKPTT
jgi:uncharacterized protein (TIGR02147 family)